MNCAEYLSLLFSWNFLCLYVYYDMPKYGRTACLLAVFGSGNLLVSCKNGVFDAASPYYDIINVVVAVGVMTTVDMFLSPGRASDMAYATYKETFQSLRNDIDELLDIDEDDQHFVAPDFAGSLT